MYPSIESRTLRILHPNGKTVGTGFLVAPNLAVTSAHVVVAMDAIDGDTIQVQFPGHEDKISALVEPQYWRDMDKGDVAFLRLDSVPDGIQPLRLAPAGSCRPGSDFRSFGYAIAADVQGIHANGKIDGYLSQHKLLQLQSPQANQGISGAPVLDEKRGIVVGMITRGHTELGRNELTTFATPTELLWEICPQLKPVVSPLPRRNPIVEGINLLPYDYDQRIQNFLTEYLGTDSHPVPFGGRDEALHMLDTWLAETTPYLLLAAPAGRGKSALLVRWLDSLKEREDVALAFVPVSIRFGTNMERVFYAALAARLAYLHGDDVPAIPETSTAVYRGLVSNYLGVPLANGRTLFVVLDGLDEAADWQAGADFLPAELPPGVRVVVSARFLAGDADSVPWRRRLNLERGGMASAPSLSPLNQAGVAEVLLRMGCPLDELSRNVDIVSELYRLSEGDPLLVGLYVGDLWTKGEKVTRLKPEYLVDIQPGYKGYFDRWWDDQKKLWGKKKPWLEQHVRAVRNLLAGALGSLFIGDIQALAPDLESDYINDALNVLQRFIIGNNEIQGYTFSHPKLGQYFWDALTQHEQDRVEMQFLAWGEQILQELVDGKRNAIHKADIPAYVVRSYGAHLTRAKLPVEKTMIFIQNQQWVQAWFSIEGAYGGYLQDVHRVWRQCKLIDRQAVKTTGKSPFLGQQIRCALIESSLHSLAGNIPPELVWPLLQNEIWTWSQAWAVIRQMPDPDQQASTILTLVPQLDDYQLSNAMQIAQAIPEERVRALILTTLIQRAKVVESGQGLELAQKFRDEKKRADVLIALVQHLPEIDLAQVLNMVQRIKDEQIRADVLIALAQRLPDRKLRRVLDAAGELANQGSCADVLIALAQYMSVNELIRVLTMAREIESNVTRARVLAALSQRMPEVGSEALETAKTIQDLRTKMLALIELTRWLPEAGEEVLRSVRAIDREFERADLLITLAQRLPETKIIKVLEMTQSIRDERSRVRVLTALIQHLPEHYLGQVIKAVQAIRNQLEREDLLTSLVQRLPEWELVQILELMEARDHVTKRVHVLLILAQRLPEVELKRLHELVNVIENEKDRADVLITLAQRMQNVKREALEVTQEIQDKVDRLKRLIALKQPLQKEDLIHIFNWAKNIQENKDPQLLKSILEQCSKVELEYVLEDLRSIRDQGELASTLSTIATNLPEEQEEQVLRAAKRIWNEYDFEKGKELSKALEYARETSTMLERILQYEPQFAMKQESIERSLDSAKKIKIEWERTRVLSALVLQIGMLPVEQSYLVIEGYLSSTAQQSRSDLLFDISALLPSLFRLSTTNTILDILYSVRDVSQWWK